MCLVIVIHQLLGESSSCIICDIHEVITQHYNERLIPNEGLGLKDSISKATRMFLTNEVEAHPGSFIDQFQQIIFSFFLEVILKFEV